MSKIKEYFQDLGLDDAPDSYYDVDPKPAEGDLFIEGGINMLDQVYNRYIRPDGSQYDLIHNQDGTKFRIELGFADKSLLNS